MCTMTTNFSYLTVSLTDAGIFLMMSDFMVRYEGTLEFLGLFRYVICVQWSLIFLISKFEPTVMGKCE